MASPSLPKAYYNDEPVSEFNPGLPESALGAFGVKVFYKGEGTPVEGTGLEEELDDHRVQLVLRMRNLTRWTDATVSMAVPLPNGDSEYFCESDFVYARLCDAGSLLVRDPRTKNERLVRIDLEQGEGVYVKAGAMFRVLGDQMQLEDQNLSNVLEQDAVMLSREKLVIHSTQISSFHKVREHYLDTMNKGFSMGSLLERGLREVGQELPQNKSGTTESVVRVLQWNTLADQLSEAFPHVDPRCVLWTNRRRMLIDEIIRCNPNVITLEEVDHFDDWFLPELRRYGYRGHYYTGGKQYGNALFYNEKELRCESVINLDYSGSRGGSAIVAHLTFHVGHKAGASIIVAGSHLKAKPGFEQVRMEQGQELLKCAKDMAERLSARCTYKERVCSAVPPIVIAGDFNDHQGSLVHDLFKGNLHSAYAKYGGHSSGTKQGGEKEEEEPMTTIKLRHRMVCRTIDYIWHDSQLVPTALLDIPEVSSLPPYGLPCPQYPSDHFSIFAQLNFVSESAQKLYQ